MNLQKSAAEKSLRYAQNNKFKAVRLDADATTIDRKDLSRAVIKDIEQLTKRNTSVTIIVINH
tara:strand:+ start:826 stop:1014 length:189 start_codon:yes stop_codon:yes gene_type:complete